MQHLSMGLTYRLPGPMCCLLMRCLMCCLPGLNYDKNIVQFYGVCVPKDKESLELPQLVCELMAGDCLVTRCQCIPADAYLSP